MAKKKYKSYLIVDGYNIINDWEELKILSVEDLDAARERLIHYIIEYSQYHGKKAIIVFDAYNVKGGTEKRENRKYITIVYTKEHQTADSYIEKYISTLSKYDKIQVATSDYAEQQIILGKGATRQKHIPLNSYVSLNKPIYDEESDRTLLDIIATSIVTDPEELIISKEELKNIENKMNELLSDLELEVLELYLSGKSYQYIANMLNRDVKSIDNALQRVKRKLEKHLENRNN